MSTNGTENDARPLTPRTPYLGPDLDDTRIFLQAALRSVGILWLLSALAPVSFVLGVPRFTWELLADEPARAWPSLLAFPVAGIALLALRRWRTTKGTKGLATLAALVLVGAIVPHAREATEALFNGLPIHFWRLAPLYLLAMALLAVGARMAYRAPHASSSHARARHLTFAIGTALLALFYAMPQRGELPVVEIGRGLFSDMSHLPGKLQVGLWAGRILALAPLVVLGACLVFTARRRISGPAVLYAFLLAYLPVLCLMAGVRSAFTGSGLGFAMSLRSAAVLGGVVVLVAAALTAVLGQLLLDAPAEHGEPSVLWRDRLLAALLRARAPLPDAHAQGADPAPPPRLALPGPLAGFALAPHASILWAHAHVALRALALHRVIALERERADHGGASEPLNRYVERRVNGQGPSPEHEHADAPPAHEAKVWLPRLGRGHRATVLAAGALVAPVALWIALSPPHKGADTWTPRAATPAAEALFKDALPGYVAALSWARPQDGDTIERRRRTLGRLADAREKLRAAARDTGGVAAPIDRFVEIAERFDYAPKSSTRAILDIGAAARAANLPFAVEPVVWVSRVGGGADGAKPWRRRPTELRPFVALKTFRVQRVRLFEAGGARAVAAWVSRLDSLNIGEGHLGRSRDDTPYAVVLVDEIRALARRLRGGPENLEPSDASGDEALDAALRGLRARALDTTQDATPGPCRDKNGTKGRGESVPIAGADCTGGLALVDAIVLSTERHELEHEADPRDVVPAALYRLMPLHSERSVRHASQEVRAYLGEMAAPTHAGATRATWLTLARTMRMATSFSDAGSAEAFAGRLIVFSMSRALGLENATEGATRAETLALAAEVGGRVAAGETQLADLATRAYARLFGREPARFTLTSDAAAP